MILMSVGEAASRYGGSSLRTVLQALAASGEWSRIYLFPSAFLCVAAADYPSNVNGFVLTEGKPTDAGWVYEDGTITEKPAVQWDQPVVPGAPAAPFPTCDKCGGVLSGDDYFLSPGPAWGYQCGHCGHGEAMGMLTAE